MSKGCKFEVGKTYKCTTGIIAKCLFAYDSEYYHCMIGEHVEGSAGRAGVKAHFSGSAWSEYKERRTITRWVNVYEHNGELSMGPIWSSRERAIYGSGNVIGYKDTISITYTEPS